MSLTSAWPTELIWEGTAALGQLYTVFPPVFMSQCFSSCPQMAQAPRVQHLPFNLPDASCYSGFRQYRGRLLIINGGDSQSDVSFGERWRGQAYGPRHWQAPWYYCCTLWSTGSVAQLTAVHLMESYEWSVCDTSKPSSLEFSRALGRFHLLQLLYRKHICCSLSQRSDSWLDMKENTSRPALPVSLMPQWQCLSKHFARSLCENYFGLIADVQLLPNKTSTSWVVGTQIVSGKLRSECTQMGPVSWESTYEGVYSADILWPAAVSVWTESFYMSQCKYIDSLGATATISILTPLDISLHSDRQKTTSFCLCKYKWCTCVFASGARKNPLTKGHERHTQDTFYCQVLK